MSARIDEPRLRRTSRPIFAAAVAGRKIEGLRRRAKYLIVDLSGGASMLVHLGMSGSLTHRDARFAPDNLDSRHDHVRFHLDDRSALVYNDPRRFGLLKLAARGELESTPELTALGPEPIGGGFNANYLVR